MFHVPGSTAIRKAIKEVTPPIVMKAFRRIRLHGWREVSLPRPLSIDNDDHVLQATRFIARKYVLDQASYFMKQNEWNNDQLFKAMPMAVKNPIPSFLFPWHYPMLDFCRGRERELQILDLCCGIPSLLLELHRMGFCNLCGADDSRFQPGIVEAAREFCSLFDLNIPIFDMRTGYSADYAALARKFDLISMFGVGSYFLFHLIEPILKVGGFLVHESPQGGVPETYQNEYEVYAKFTGICRFGSKGAVTIFRRIA